MTALHATTGDRADTTYGTGNGRAPDRHIATTETTAEAEAVAFTRRLIRFDTRNACTDSPDRCNERPAAQWAADRLAEAGIAPTIMESAPGRAIVTATLPGMDRSLPPLLIHGHLDTVPVDPAQWSVDPFGGEIRTDADGIPCVWGRGAVDMKDMVGMTLAALRSLARNGTRPRRDVRLALLPDEEAGGRYGSIWVAEHRPDIFAHVGYVVSETGGFSDQVNGRRVYYVQVGEKGTQWFRLEARGTQSHGSQINRDNAVVRIAEAACRIAAYRWPVDVNPVTRMLLDGLRSLTDSPAGSAQAVDDEAVRTLVRHAGATEPWIASSLRNTFNVSSIDADSTVNVIPATASALVDGRALPGQEEPLLRTLRSLAGDGVTVSAIHRSNGYLSDPSGALFRAAANAIHEFDPQARVLPFLSSGGTDSKAVLGVSPGAQALGFAPLRTPPAFRYIARFHGVDERVPVESLRFGERVLERFIATL
ncbi:M20/M25/M40 family metallo-hydrolase [Bifidobacterium avesanii]|uniref:M20/M25/M40 family metallo-hydrolase n=1 Tax=Bifidobacterium avesanii TaxID=1798157 RepID=A0A7K3TIF4_9BIFI|nr:M20/M25/M40 family metallo-hydrolase [Bifidobacterium avesanii]KAB8290927.1 Peptidase family M20/M25/M40 [Bifidobacterium avesanii]NEG78885.1 M20/M25/M40 family metallo-hydrolase [Bifidobacterium avesanii]